MPVRVSKKKSQHRKVRKSKAVSAKGKNYKAAGVGRTNTSARRRSITR